MKTPEQLRDSWNASEDERATWKAMSESSTWNKVSELVMAEITEEATSGMDGIVGDTIYARKLKEIETARKVIYRLQQRWILPVEVKNEEIEAFSDEYVKAYQERKELAQQQQ